MSKEHTARTIAEIIVSNAYIGYTVGTNERAIVDSVEGILAPHLRKPSDDEWIKNAAFLLQKAITSYDNTKSVNTDEIRRFLNKGAVTADMERVEENMGASKSVPQRCEEAYDGAINLIMEIGHRLNEPSHRYIIGKIDDFLQKPNPFKEAVITDDKPEPRLLPFDLKAAQDGAKVVTHGGKTEVKIVADNISSSHPILATYSVLEGGVYFDQFDLEGRRKHISDKNMNLFILKEPETVYIDILRQEDGALYTCLYKDIDETYPIEHGTDIIKTITVTI